MAQGATEARTAAAATDHRLASVLGATRRLRRHGAEPAHCLADRPALPRDDGGSGGSGAPLNRTTVFLAGGFGFGGHAMRAAGGDAAPWAPAAAVATYLLWGSAKRVGWLYDPDARTYDTAVYYRDVVLSPPPFHSATWAPANCRAQVRSDVCAAPAERR